MTIKDLGTNMDRQWRVDLNNNFRELSGMQGSVNDAINKSKTAEQIANEAKTKADTANNTSNSVQEQLNQVVIDGDSSVEAAQARVDEKGIVHPTLKDRIDLVGIRTDTISKQSMYTRNASKKLNIRCYDGDNQAIHTSTLYFPNGWNGYKFWMAYTPYTFMDEFVENPCMACSNDGAVWIEPTSGLNPMNAPTEAERGKKHNSDTSLLYRSDLNRLEIWWRRVDRDAGTTFLMRRTSTDGKIWTATETINNNWGVCPVVKFENGKYRLWCYSVSDNAIRYGEATEPDFNFGKARNIDTYITPFEGRNYKLWHFDIRQNEQGLYEMLGSYKATEDPNGETQQVFYSYSLDNITYSKPQIFMKTGRAGNFDSKMTYKPDFVKVDDKIFLYMTGKSLDQTWGTGLSISDTGTLFDVVGTGSDFLLGYTKPNDVTQGLIDVSINKLIAEYLPERIHPNNIIPKNYKVGKQFIDTVSNKPLYLISMGNGYWSKNVWTANQALPTVGYRIVDNNVVYEVKTSGASGATKPTFNSAVNAETTDGTATWISRGTKATIVDGVGVIQ